MMVNIRLLPFEIDHIISEKHAGATISENLCLACYRCNSYKGSDIASTDPLTGAATYRFHPRQQVWEAHFQLDEAILKPLSPEGRVTVFLLRFNVASQIAQRKALIMEKRYPCTPPRSNE